MENLPTIESIVRSPAWLETAVREQLGERPARGPGWLALEELPRVRVAGQPLGPHETHAAVNALRDSTPERPAPLVALLRRHAEAESLDAFARDLARRWLDAGAPSQHRWALEALAFWGGDAAAVFLAGLIRVWPAQNLHRRATEALTLLRRMGSETALLELALLARGGRPRRLQQTAAGLLATVAGERGLSRDQLDDRTVPDLGLDADGGRTLDFGPRQFRLLIGGNLKPLLRDGHGAVRASLPPGKRDDDPVKVEKARADWKLLAKQLRDVLSHQKARLEQAMLAGRRWPAGEFERYLVRHPVVGLLTRRLLWATVDPSGRPGEAFRVTEDRTFARADESPFRLAPDAHVRLLHPLHLAAEGRRAWVETLTDHEIVPPFPQLGRSVRMLLPAEESSRTIERQGGVRVPCITLLGTLDRLGWDRGPGHGLAVRHVKYFPSADVLAVLEHTPGVPMHGFLRDWDDQTLGACYFVPGIAEPTGGFQPAAAMRLADVDPVLLSEVLGLVETLAGKAVAPGEGAAV